MVPLLALDLSSAENWQEIAKMLFSTGSLVVTLYFWFVRANRERFSVGVHVVSGFEGSLEPGGIGVWSGKVFVANRSILPTAIVAGRAELWWEGRWLAGRLAEGDGSELPWNLPASQAYAKNVVAVFDLGRGVSVERIYARQRMRLIFETVEGRNVVGKVRTGEVGASLAA